MNRVHNLADLSSGRHVQGLKLCMDSENLVPLVSVGFSRPKHVPKNACGSSRGDTARER